MLNFLQPYKLYVYIAICAFLFASGAYSGYKLTSNHYEAKAADEMRAVIEQANEQAKIDVENAVKANAIIDAIRYAGLESRSKARKALAAHPQVAATEIPQDIIDAWNDSHKQPKPASTSKVDEVVEKIKERVK